MPKLPLLFQYRYMLLKKTLQELRYSRITFTEDPIEMEKKCDNHNDRIESLSRQIASEITDYVSHMSISLTQLGHKLPASLHGLKETILNMAVTIVSCGYEENVTDSLAMDIAGYNHPRGDGPLIATKEDLIEEKRKGFEEGYESALSALRKTAFSPRKLDLEET
jgi:hypothetical protein